MKPLFPMTERDDGARRPETGTPTIPRARTADAAGGSEGEAARSAAPGTAAPRSRSWRGRGWDIPWLGGRSTAPWVVLATVVILLIALIGQLYAK
jgi:hypothetical protein